MAPREHATVIHAGTPESADVVAGIRRAWRLVTRLNALSADDAGAVRACFAELTGREIDAGFRLVPPFHTDHGRNLRVGRNVFINHGCTAMDIASCRHSRAALFVGNVLRIRLPVRLSKTCAWKVGLHVQRPRARDWHERA
jgi:hypothetical protein